RVGPRRAAVIRVGAMASAGLAVLLWPYSTAAYGFWFWLWLCALVAYAFSFAPATCPREAPSPAALAWLMAIIGVAVALRLPGIKANPANISIDELLPGLEAARIARGGAANVFSSIGWFTIPNVCFAFPAIVMKLAGAETFLPLRLSSLLTGIGGV